MFVDLVGQDLSALDLDDPVRHGRQGRVVGNDDGRLNKTTEAQSLMNRVRGRQGVNLPGKSSSGEAWFNDYRNERKIELCLLYTSW